MIFLALVFGGLAVVGVGGVIGLGIQAASKPKTSMPATPAQKIARVGFVGALAGAGAYAYVSGQRR